MLKGFVRVGHGTGSASVNAGAFFASRFKFFKELKTKYSLKKRFLWNFIKFFLHVQAPKEKNPPENF